MKSDVACASLSSERRVVSDVTARVHAGLREQREKSAIEKSEESFPESEPDQRPRLGTAETHFSPV